MNPWITTYLPLVSSLIVAAATVILVLVTAKYVRLTGRLVEETQRAREPSVSIDFEIPDNSLRLVVSNHGLSAAKNIRIEVLKDIPWLKKHNRPAGLICISPIQEGISYLAPSRKLKYHLGYPNWEDTTEDQMEVSLRVCYQNEANKNSEHIVNFDFGQMREVLFESFQDSNLAVAKAIRDTERNRQSHERMRNLFSGQRKAMKQCPMCAEMIPQEAKKCSHCQELLNGTEIVN